jgi:hypothetical protein
VIVLGFGIASWLLTGAALRPVTRMRKQARTRRAEIDGAVADRLRD